MPRQRPRRRRRKGATAADSRPEFRTTDDSRAEQTIQPGRRWWLPSAGVVTGTGVGIWLGVVFGGAGGLPETISLWVGVLMAGLGGGRIFRRSLQNRQDRRR